MEHDSRHRFRNGAVFFCFYLDFFDQPCDSIRYQCSSIDNHERPSQKRIKQISIVDGKAKGIIEDTSDGKQIYAGNAVQRDTLQEYILCFGKQNMLQD